MVQIHFDVMHDIKHVPTLVTLEYDHTGIEQLNIYFTFNWPIACIVQIKLNLRILYFLK